MTNDPIAERHESTLDPAAQRAIRRRVHWLCAQVEGSDVLDVGCGDGAAALLLGREGHTVVGIDHAQPVLDEAERRLAAEADVVRGRVRLLHAQANDLPLPDGSFDTVLLGEVLEHQVRPRPVLDEAARLLRPGGTLVVAVGYGPGDDREPVSIRAMLELLAERFTVDRLEPVEGVLGIVAGPRRDVSPEERIALLDAALAAADARVEALGGWLERGGDGSDAPGALLAELTAARASVARAEEAAAAAERLAAEHEQAIEDRAGEHRRALAARDAEYRWSIDTIEMRAHEDALEAEQALAQLAAEHRQSLLEVTGERDEALAQLTAARERLDQADGRVAVSEAEHAEVVARLAAEHEADRGRLAAEHENALARVAAERETALAQLAAEHDETLVQLVAGHDETLSQLAAEYDETLSQLAAEHDETLSRLAAEQEKRRAQLAAAHDESAGQIAELEGVNAALAERSRAMGERLAGLETRMALETEAANAEANRARDAQRELAALRRQMAGLEQEAGDATAQREGDRLAAAAQAAEIAALRVTLAERETASAARPRSAGRVRAAEPEAPAIERAISTPPTLTRDREPEASDREPALRVGRVGDAWMPSIPEVALVPIDASAARNGLAEELGRLDLVLVGPSDEGPGSTPPAWLADAAATAEVPVLVLPPPAGGETAWHGPGKAGADRAPGRLLVLPPVDVRVINPTGFRQQTDERFAAVAGAGHTPEPGRVAAWLDSEAELPFLTVFARSSRRLASVLRQRGEIVTTEPFDAGGVVEDLRGCRAVVDHSALHADPVSRAARLVSLAAAGVPLLLRDRDPALEDALGPELLWAIDRFDERTLADTHLREAASVAMRRVALARHGTRSTWGRLSAAVGVTAPADAAASLILATKRPRYLEFALEQVAAQTYANRELVLVLHGDAFDTAATQRLLDRHPDVATTIVRVPDGLLLGEALNHGTEAASGDVIVKFDDDDWYDAHHLEDLMLALEYSGAVLVGKAAEFIYLADVDVTVRRWSTRSERDAPGKLGGPTLTIRKSDLRQIGGWQPVARQVDQRLLKDVDDAGGRVYRTHGFGFILNRHGSGHTWTVDTDYFLTRADAQWRGLALEAAEVTPVAAARVPIELSAEPA